VDVAARVEKRPTVALEALHDEALAAEKARADFLVEGNPDAHALGRAKEGIFLRPNLAAHFREVDRNNLTGIGCAKRHALLPLSAILKHGHEKRFAGQ